MDEFLWTSATPVLEPANYALGHVLVRFGDAVGQAQQLAVQTIPRIAPDGTAALPGMAFGSDPDTGFLRPAANVLAASVGGAEAMRLTATGLGVGGVPTSRMHAVNGALRSTGSEGGVGLFTEGAWRHTSASAMFFDITTGGPAQPVTFRVGSDFDTKLVIEAAGHLRPGGDNSRTLGSSSFRWSTVFAGTGTINTSDERTKRWHGIDPERREVFLRIAERILDELGWFQFEDAINDKGEYWARWHFGARAQRVWAIVADEGLAPPLVEINGELLPDLSWQGPPAPAWLTFNSWTDIHVPEMRTVPVPATLDGEGNVLVPATVTQEPTGRMILDKPAGYAFGFRPDQIALLTNWALHSRLREQAARMQRIERMLEGGSD